jgi:NOL1/NOP2/sun family putative RNA methylase
LESLVIPPLFLENISRLLGEQAAAFQSCYQEPPIAGLRVNTLKVDPAALLSRLPYDLRPLPWSPAGYQLVQPAEIAPDDPNPVPLAPGKHAFHAAGLYYLQEPSAMAVAALLDPQPGETVLDLCAAPGGKTTHLAALMADEGLLVANETHPKRVWELAENLERWGVHSTIITNENPPKLAEHMVAFFDKVLVDAPCSGEGMFRKSAAARRDWSPALTVTCSLRQSAILDSAALLLKPGGVLAYSTCTFNPLENETTVARFLKRHPDFELLPVQPCSGFSPGRPDWVAAEDSLPELSFAVRIWPHLGPAEGHFVALLRRVSSSSPISIPKPQKKPLKARKSATQSGHRSLGLSLPHLLPEFLNFCQQNLQPSGFSQSDVERLLLKGAYLYLQPAIQPDLAGLRLIHPGLWLGSLSAGKASARLRFEPSHALAMSLRIEQAQRCLDFASDSPQISAYLRGETLNWEGEDGWVLLAVNGYPLGWGKSVRGLVKNYYPRGLRRV